MTPHHHRCTAVVIALLFILFGQIRRLESLTAANGRVRDNWDVPCKFLDSINITGLPMEESDDGAGAIVTLGKHRYTVDMVGDFDYEILNDTFRQPTMTHQRACVCHDRPCVRLMCLRGWTYSEEMGTCLADERLFDSDIDVRLANGSIQKESLFENFGYTVGRVCSDMTELDVNMYEDDAWELHENGTITTLAGQIYNQHEYNMVPFVNETTKMVQYTILYCFHDYEDIRFALIPIGMALSVPFLIATFLVYAILPELRNVHGKSLMSYLAGLAIASSLLAYLQKYSDTESAWCRPLGYGVYFWFMASFFWLNVISFDLWWNFRGIRGISKLNENRRFMVYSAYAWGLALFMVLLCYGLDNSSWVPGYIKPGFGVMKCYFRADRWIEFFYFYLPLMLIFLANAIFFTLTALKIRRVQMEMVRVTSKEDSRRHKSQFEQEKDKYGLFLRLFIVMGVTWSMEVVSFLVDPSGWPFYISDAMNCVQGVVIFVLFVMKPKVKKLLVKRWKAWRGIVPLERNSSFSATMSTQVTNSTSAVPATSAKASLLTRGVSATRRP